MKNRWITSDTHYGHKNIIKFTKPDGTPIRPRLDGTPFSCIEEHDELLIQRHNERVAPNDDVYHLGDFGRPIEIMERLNGKFRIILGNHDDIHSPKVLAKYFEKVLCSRDWREDFAHRTLLTHFPVHADESKPAVRKINVHGHIHEKIIYNKAGHPDPWYVNVCVEHTELAPMHWDELEAIIAKRAKQVA